MSQEEELSALDPSPVPGQGTPCHAPRVVGGGPLVGMAGDWLSEAPVALQTSAWVEF